MNEIDKDLNIVLYKYIILNMNCARYFFIAMGLLYGGLSLNPDKLLISDKIVAVKRNFQSKIMKSIGGVIGTAIIIGNPMDTLAASSGSRSGGSSFRSSSSSSSYRNRGSTRLNAGSYNNIIMPMYGYGFSPLNFIPINGNLLLFGSGVFIVYNLLKNRIGGSEFSNNDVFGSLGSGATIIKLQIGVVSNWSKSSNIMDVLSSIARESGKISGRSKIANLLSETSIALLIRKSSWNSASMEGEKFDHSLKAEPYFQKLVIQERTKFESETANVGYPDIDEKDEYVFSKPTQSVVSIIVAIRGTSDALKINIRNANDLSNCLQTLASEALTDDGENIMAVEVLWTPSESGTILTEKEVIMDYPELIKL